MGSTNNDDKDVMEDQALCSGQFKGKCRNCGQIGHKSYQCKNRGNRDGGNNSNSNTAYYCTYCRKTGHVKKDCFKLKKKENQNDNNHASKYTSNHDRQNFDSTDVAFMATLDTEYLSYDIWIYDSGACGHYCNFKQGLSDTREINEGITIGNGKSMIAAKVHYATDRPEVPKVVSVSRSFKL